MQDIHYHLEKPYSDQSLLIKVDNQTIKARVTKFKSSSPDFIDSVFIRQEGLDYDSSLKVIGGKWQVELLPDPHNVIFLKSIVSSLSPSIPRTRIPFITKENSQKSPSTLQITTAHQDSSLSSCQKITPQTPLFKAPSPPPPDLPATLRIITNNIKDDIRYHYVPGDNLYKLKISAKELPHIKDKYYFDDGTNIFSFNIIRDSDKELGIKNRIIKILSASKSSSTKVQISFNGEDFQLLKLII